MKVQWQVNNDKDPLDHPFATEFMTLAAARREVTLSISHLSVLGMLLIEPGATPSRLSDLLGIEIDQVSRALSELRTKIGAADFEPDRRDARVKHFYLTRAGAEIAVKWLRARGHHVPDGMIDSIPLIKRTTKSRVTSPKDTEEPKDTENE